MMSKLILRTTHRVKMRKDDELTITYCPQINDEHHVHDVPQVRGYGKCEYNRPDVIETLPTHRSRQDNHVLS